MSASLVGSEMCIRDSSWRGCPGPGGAPRAGSPSAGLACAPRTRGALWACLLYTSDAADDM
eukprot:14929772-Alexandrium_andersonii.AAC.1